MKTLATVKRKVFSTTHGKFQGRGVTKPLDVLVELCIAEELGMGIAIMPKGKTDWSGLFVKGIDSSDPIILYRIFSAFDTMKVIRGEAITALYFACAKEDMPTLKELLSLQESQIKLILSALHPELENILLALHDAKIPVHTCILEALLDAGRLKLTPAMQKVGVVAKDVRERRKKAAQVLKARWLPAIHAFVDAKKWCRSQCVDYILQAASCAFAKGATEDAVAIGIGLCAQLSMRALTPSLEDFGPFAVIRIETLEDPYPIVGTFLATHFREGRTAQAYTALLREWGAKWETTPYDEKLFDTVKID